jgi:hypothetical protein
MSLRVGRSSPRTAFAEEPLASRRSNSSRLLILQKNQFGFLQTSYVFKIPDRRETGCDTWHALRPPHFVRCALLRHLAPGSLSQGSNLQKVFSPGTACRRGQVRNDPFDFPTSLWKKLSVNEKIRKKRLRSCGQNALSMI